jgi:hypothetical protein
MAAAIIFERDLCAMVRKGGWSGDLKLPSRTQIKWRLGRVRKLRPEQKRALTDMLESIFPGLLRELKSVTELRGDGGGRTIAAEIREEISELAQSLSQVQRFLENTSPLARAALEASSNENMPRARSASARFIRELRSRLLDDLAILETLLERVELQSKPGPYDPFAEEMVENLLAHFMRVIGHIPGRTYQVHDGKKGGAGGPFLDLCRGVYALAINRLPKEQRPKKAPRFTGIVEVKIRGAKLRLRAVEALCRNLHAIAA